MKNICPACIEALAGSPPLPSKSSNPALHGKTGQGRERGTENTGGPPWWKKAHVCSTGQRSEGIHLHKTVLRLSLRGPHNS